MIKDLNVRAETIKLLEGATGVNLHDLKFDNDFLTMTPEAQATQVEVNKWVYIKLNTFYTEMETEN